jgi:UDP-3-O-[3-hydroxymyristoyl] glucosamine N-acyltransferase
MSGRTHYQAGSAQVTGLKRVLEILGDAVINVIGPAERTITHPAPIHEAQSEMAITFSAKADVEALEQICDTKAGVVLCPSKEVINELTVDGKTLIVVTDPRLSFLRLVQALFTEPKPKGIHPTAAIDPEANIHPDVYIGPFTYIGKCEIGAGTVIYGHVYIYSKTRIGRDVIIHAGTVIGADGFGYHRNELGKLEKFPQVGGVVIEDNVEIGSNTSIDRGTLGNTIVREGAKINNLVHIAHNVVVGRHAVVNAHASVSGSTRIGDYAWVAPNASLRDGISIGERVTVGMGAVVVKDVPDGATVMGVPARPVEEYKLMLKALRQLADKPDRSDRDSPH